MTCLLSCAHPTKLGLGLHLQSARTALRRAQKATQESFAAYTASLETERRVSHEVAALEDRRDHLCNSPIPHAPALPRADTNSIHLFSISALAPEPAPANCDLPLSGVRVR